MPRSLEINLLLAIVVAQVAILVGMIAFDGLPLVLGQRIKLKVVPVDPRDFFRGDYVVLGYEFTRFDPVSFAGSAPRPGLNSYHPEWVGRDIYVSLAPAGDHYEATTRSIERPSSGLYIRGTVPNGWQNRLECGIEAYYVQEGEGRRLEQLLRERRLLAEVAVWHGRAKLVRLVE
jgi:uncharacterized membrane-anchored protein